MMNTLKERILTIIGKEQPDRCRELAIMLGTESRRSRAHWQSSRKRASSAAITP